MIIGIEFSKTKHEGKTFVRVAPYIQGADTERITVALTVIVLVAAFIWVSSAIAAAQ